MEKQLPNTSSARGPSATTSPHLYSDSADDTVRPGPLSPADYKLLLRRQSIVMEEQVEVRMFKCAKLYSVVQG